MGIDSQRGGSLAAIADGIVRTNIAEIGAVEAAFAALSSDFRDRVEQRMRELEWQFGYNTLSPELIKSRCIVDWEAGDCAFAIGMLRMGAQRVYAIDSWLDAEKLLPILSGFPGLFVCRTDIDSFSAALGACHTSVDLVFCNTVTEHMQDLVSSLRSIKKIIRPDGYFFTNHDNYYQPAGSHDHGFLFYGDGPAIIAQGVDCWNLPDRCQTSEAHRVSIKTNFPWTWDDKLENTRDPENCAGCFYFRRSQPWAHLIYSADFRNLFSRECFCTGTANSSLNKITTFQLRQYLVEAGFNIHKVHRTQVVNQPPSLLLEDPFFFNPDELRTCTMSILAQAI